MSQKDSRLSVRKGYSQAEDESQAVSELIEAIDQPNVSTVIFFTSARYDLDRLSTELKRNLRGTVIGCTTSGEITPVGYTQNSLVGLSIASDELEVHPYLVPDLHSLDSARTQETISTLQGRLEHTRKTSPEAGLFGLLLVDGLSIMEEQVVAILANAVGEIPIVGGSAGDDLKLEKTYVYHDGKFVTDAALFALFSTTLPFAPLKTQHFTASDKRMVITKASPESRIVYEINGRPAAEEYANVIGLRVRELTPTTFSEYPVMLRLGGEYYVRSIQKVNEDGSLTFFCAIDEGLVLRVAKGENLVKNLKEAFEQVRIEIPKIRLTIGFDCILRLLEVQNKTLQNRINKIFAQNNVIGFNTYGEQFGSVHVNQTFTGIVLGE